jgi:glutamate-5-semialdehyde dehydrogenase
MTVLPPTTPSLHHLVDQAQQAASRCASLDAAMKNHLLALFAENLRAATPQLLAANAEDIAQAGAEGLTGPMLQRLKLDEGKLAQLAKGILDVASLTDPANRTLSKLLLDDGLVLEKKTCPLGVVLVIFESRPDALPQILSLMLKSGNAIIFKGGRESQRTCDALMQHVVAPLSDALPQLPAAWAQGVQGREAVQALLAFDKGIDLVIPRGSNALVRQIMDSTHIPVLGHADGICHLYVDTSADLAQAIPVVIDAKTQYPAACNALETLLVHHDVLTPVCQALAAQGSSIRLFRGPAELAPYFGERFETLTDEAEWATEYGDVVLAIRPVADVHEALAHIARHGSRHTDGILATDPHAIQTFVDAVDSASVMVNASTRFADGFRYGLGAEVGISTSKTHARGPVGLEGLVSTRYLLTGHGHTVAPFVGNPPQKQFQHKPL